MRCSLADRYVHYVPSSQLVAGQESARQFVRVRAASGAVDVVSWLSGEVVRQLPDRPATVLFGIEGFTIMRAHEASDGWTIAGREVWFHTDSGRDEILDHWTDPVNGRVVEVSPVWATSSVMRLSDHKRHDRSSPIGPDAATVASDASSGPSAVTRFTVERLGDTITYCVNSAGLAPAFGSESVRYTARLQDLSSDSSSVACRISVARVSGLPAALSGEADGPQSRPGGYLLYHLDGRKLAGGYGELPARLRERVEADRPEFAFAPTESAGSSGERRGRTRKSWLSSRS